VGRVPETTVGHHLAQVLARLHSCTNAASMTCFVLPVVIGLQLAVGRGAGRF
jgi:hypothetical protein